MIAKRALRTFEECLLEMLQDPEETQEYLKVSLEEYKLDKDFKVLLRSLRIIAQAKGGVLEGSNHSEPDQRNLDSILSENPNLGWNAILEALGFTFKAISVEHVPSF